MKAFFICIILLIINICLFSQSKHENPNSGSIQQGTVLLPTDSAKSRIDNGRKKHNHKKMTAVVDTLSKSDFMMSIDRVNDHLNSIRDSVKLGFEVVRIGRRIDEIRSDIKIIRMNIRDKHAVVNLKNLYLYQSFAANLDEENEKFQKRLRAMYHQAYHGKLRLKTVLSDSVFRVLIADTIVQNGFDDKLVRLERKWAKTDSIAKASVDTINSIKVKVAENSVNLSNMLTMMDNRLDKAGQQLFGTEINYLWLKDSEDTIAKNKTNPITFFASEQKAIGYYFSQTSGERVIVLLLGILLLIWLFFKRKLLKAIKIVKEDFEHLHLQYLNSNPIVAMLVVLLCLMPFFDAYAPASYIYIEYTCLLIAATIIFLKKRDLIFRINWLMLISLFIIDAVFYLILEPTFIARLCILGIHGAIIFFLLQFYRKLNSQDPYTKWIKRASIGGITFTSLAIICNLFGRFSLSRLLGITGIFATTQAAILPVFVDSILEFILLQLQSSRMKKGINKPFESSPVLKRIKVPLVIIAVVIWLIMLASNLNLYHTFSNYVIDFLTVTRKIGSISFELLSILLFFAIIWLAHILQRIVSFLFGETGTDTEDMTTVTKGQHSRLLITRLLLLIGGYLLAIAASGLPIDKLTFLLGALGVGIGMGLQHIVNNFVSGIILIFDGSLQIGDEIEVGGQSGKVKEIGLRSSTLNTADGASVIIPNGNILSQNIINWSFSTDQKRDVIEFKLTGKELDSNVINDVINNVIIKMPQVNSKKKPVILYNKVTNESCNLTVRFWSTLSNAEQIKSEAMLKLSSAFASRNILFE